MLTSLRYVDIYQTQKFFKSYSTNSPPALGVLLCSAARVKMMLSMFHCLFYPYAKYSKSKKLSV